MYPTINITKCRPICDRAKEMTVKQPQLLASLLLAIAVAFSLFAVGCKSEDKPAFMRSTNDEVKMQQRQRRDMWRQQIDGQRKARLASDRELDQVFLDGLEKIRLNDNSAKSCRRATDTKGVYDTSHCTPEQLKAEQDFEKE